MVTKVKKKQSLKEKKTNSVFELVNESGCNDRNKSSACCPKTTKAHVCKRTKPEVQDKNCVKNKKVKLERRSLQTTCPEEENLIQDINR